MNAYMGGYQGAGMGRSEGLGGDPARTGENALGRHTGRGVRRSDEEHPWHAASRWSKSWRVALGVLATWLIAALLSLLLFADGRIEYFAPSWLAAMPLLLLPPILCAVLAAVLQGWLKRYLPVSQSLLFGLVAYAVAVAITSLASLGWRAEAWGCTPGAPCLDGFWQQASFTALALLPGVLVAALGYLLAMGSVTRVGKWVLASALGAALLVAVILLVVLTARGSGAG